jgi:mRNA interferase RelE/StbE
MYEVLIPKSVQKELDKISDIYYPRIRDKIFEMENNPRPIGSIKLSDSDEYRIRVGTFRILYEIDDKKKTVKIYKIEHRKDVYRKN